MKIHLACFAVFASCIQFVTGQTLDTTISTDQEFSQSITSLVRRYDRDINAVTEKMNVHLRKAVNKTSDTEWERRFEGQMKRLRGYNLLPVDLELVDLAAQEQYEKCLLSMSFYRVLNESKNIALKKNWLISSDNCDNAFKRLIKENKILFSFHLYSLLIPGAKFELVGGPEMNPLKVVFEIIHRNRGVITAKVKGKFWFMQDGELERECKFALPQPTNATRNDPGFIRSFVRESDLAEIPLEIKFDYKGFFKDRFRTINLRNSDDLPVYKTLLILTAILKSPKNQDSKDQYNPNDPVAQAVLSLSDFFLENKSLTSIVKEYRMAVSIIGTK